MYYTGGDEPLVTPLETAQLAAQFTPEEVLATLEMHAAGGVQLSGTGSMHWPLGAEAPLEGRIAGRLPDIAPLLPWIAGNFGLAEVVGGVTLDAGVAGTLAAPRVTGGVRLSGGSIALADLGVTLKDIDVALLGDGSDALKLQGSAKAGGPLTLDGELRPIEEGGPTGWVRIRGNKVDAVRLPDRYIQASPDLTLRYAGGEFSTEGGVTIPKAEIVVRALPESAVSPSNDTVVHDREVPEAGAGRGRIIGGEFAVTLGPEVRLKAFGLDTLLEGTVKLSQGADGEPKGYGVVRLKEELALGQCVWGLAYRWNSLTGGDNGINLRNRPKFGIDLSHDVTFFYLVFGFFAASLLAMYVLVQSPFGRSLAGIRERELPQADSGLQHLAAQIHRLRHRRRLWRTRGRSVGRYRRYREP